MDSAAVTKVIDDFFKEDPEIYEVAMYVNSTMAINYEVLRSMMMNETEVKNIPPEAYHLMKRFDNGLTQNRFWHENFGPLKAQLAIIDIKLNSMRMYAAYGEQKGDMNALKQVRAILLSQVDALTMLAFLWKGVQFAEEFDAKVRIAFQLSPEHEKYFTEKGI